MFDKLARTLSIVAALAVGGTAVTSAQAAVATTTTTSTTTAVAPKAHAHATVRVAEMRHHRHFRRAVTCSPRQAVHKAYRMGFRHAHLRRVGRHAITVAGIRHHRRAAVRFSRAPSCPVIAYRR
ncbi:hypothetical protein [Jiella sp. M17.18]|uniref:hypothetical protein n=1 Tax=Jiella sp. M17.18 TaxID=3234247 RepID=UPI0034DF5EEB